MSDALMAVLRHKQLEVEQIYRDLDKTPEHPIKACLSGERIARIHENCSLKQVIQSVSGCVIAELKRQSPSQGHLSTIQDPVSLAERLILGGAQALSVLTDKAFFGGSFSDLTQVAHCVSKYRVPVLCKEFVIDVVQIAAAYLAGAHAVLLIVGLVPDRLKHLMTCARALGLDSVVEIHDQCERSIALDAGAEIVMVNNRNLRTLTVNPWHALRIQPLLPSSVVQIAASGLADPIWVKQYFQAGFDAVLVGEALMRTEHPEAWLKACFEGSTSEHEMCEQHGSE